MSTSRRASIARELVAAWLGAVALFGAVVAPAAFAVLPTRALAGAFVGRVLPTLFLAGVAAGAVLLIGARGMPASARRRGTFAAASAVIVACAIAQFVIGPRIERVRASSGVALDQLPADHPTRVTFGRLHGLSVAGLGVAAVGAALALVLLRPAMPSSRERAS